METPVGGCPVLEGYVALRSLGSGQFGDVFLVRRTRDARLFAAKIPRAGGSDADAQEARLLQRLEHPNVVRCEDVVRVDGGRRLAIVMEYAAMGDLEAYIQGFAQRKETIPEDEIMRIFLQIVLALAYLHEERVLHRDLKPKNVLLDVNGVVKLSDFGVSRSLVHTLDAAQTVTGTPHYMSPELMDNQPYDGKTDVWSLGCILFELATLAPPFAAKALATLVMQIVSHPPPTLPPKYSRDLDSLVKKLLAKLPSVRPSIREVLLEPFVQQHLLRLACIAPIASELRCHHQQSSSQLERNSASLTPCVRNEFSHMPQPQELSAPKRLFVTPLDQAVQQSDETELRRKMFFENQVQAAAQRNKDRVALEKVAPPVFLHYDEPTREADRPRNVAGQIQRASQDIIDAERERARQFYLENARAAKLNKQRAIEAMKGQAEAILLAEPVGDAGVGSVAPPPAPPRRVDTSGGKAFEALLEEERRRVRMERKLLQERMRECQTSNSSEATDIVVAAESPF